MRSKLLRLSLLLCILTSVSFVWSLVSDYSFNSTTNTYTEISGGTLHGDATNDAQVFNAVSIGFNFNYNGTFYDQISIASDGFIAMGPTVTASNLAISGGTTNNVVVALNRDLKSRTDGSLMTLLSGTAPTRKFTIQWKNYRRSPASTATDTLNFQIVLNETTNVIQYCYGHFYAANYAVAATVQCGLRGAANTEYNNRTTTTDWTATTAGTANTSNCRMNDAVVPPQGLVFTWTPVQAGVPPNPAQIVSPANAATNVSLSASLNWLSGGGAQTGYKVYFGTNNPPTNIANGLTQTGTTYNPDPDMSYNTQYYWQIVPYNEFGDAIGCPVWSFTTMPDPTVTTYPYVQNWDSATAPTVPNTWTVINANNDANAWVLVNTAGAANSSPNVIRCNLNQTAAMDDWFISPPLSVIADTFYRVQFYYKAQNAAYPEKLEVKLGTANTVAAMTTQIFNNANITNTTYAMGNVTFGPVPAGIYYLGWHGYSNANMFQLYVDDITIFPIVPVFNPPLNLTATSALNSVVLNWQVPVESVPVGYKVFKDGALITPTPIAAMTYTDNNVVIGTNYSYYVTAVYNNPDGESVPSNTVQGTPQEALIPPVALTALVNNYNVTLNWLTPGSTPPGALEESFEATAFPPTDWTQVITETGPANTSGVYPTWCRIGPLTISGQACNPTEGNWQAGMWWSYNHQDEWLKTPQFLCPAGASLVFDSYVFLGSTNGDHYYVKVSTDNGVNWTVLWDASALTGGWNYYMTPITISLAAYANQNIKVAWHADDPSATSDGMWYTWFIDDVEITTAAQRMRFRSEEMTLVSAANSRSAIITTNEYASKARAMNPALTEPVLREPNRSLTGYKVYRNGTLINTITNPATLTYADNNLLPNTYSYTVTATYTGNLESVPAGPAQAIVVGIFNPPSALVGTATATNVGLTWNAPNPIVGNLAGYKVFRNGTLITPTPIAGTTYTDNSVTVGNTYIYYVTAAYTNPNGESAQSNSVTVPFGDNLDPVTDLAANVAMDDVMLTWVPPGGPILLDWIHIDDGNNDDGIGFNGPGNFDVAARFTQTELTGLHDRALVRVRFYPFEVNCTYTIKIYTGGTSYLNPGNLIHSIPVTNPVIDAWNEIDLPAPLQIPTTNELWISVSMVAQAGYPAGCDDGPSIPYKGNMIYFNGAWDALSAITDPIIDVNWNIQGLVTNHFGELSVLAPVAETHAPVVQNVGSIQRAGLHKAHRDATRDPDRSLIGYKVYRDGTLISTINDVLVSNYTDANLPNGTYNYTVTALYTGNLESPPAGPVPATVDVVIVPTIFEDGFETYSNFALTFAPWMLNDVDQSTTFGITNTTFPNSGSPMAYIIFNPSATTPPMTNLTTHGGAKMAASIGAETAPNNDWLITPKIHLGTQSSISFWAKSYTSQYGLERFRVGVSTQENPLPATFAYLSGASHVEAPVDWTLYTYQVPTAYNNQNVRFGIRCVSDNAFIFFVDDFKIQGYNGYVGSEDSVIPVNTTALIGNYPNPFNPETIISYNVKDDAPVTVEIYNLKGQKVKTLVNGMVKSGTHSVTWNGTDDNDKKVTSGVYFYRMSSGKYSSSRKMILMK